MNSKIKMITLLILCLLGIDPSCSFAGHTLGSPPLIAASQNNSTTQMPSFQQGNHLAFTNWVNKHTTYPKEAKIQKLQDVVMVKFVIDPTGKVVEVQAVRGKHPILNQAAEELIRKSPRWEPGTENGKKVRIQMIIPVNYRL